MSKQATTRNVPAMNEAQPQVWMRGIAEPWEWPAWSREGVQELRNEFELGYDCPAWDDPFAYLPVQWGPIDPPLLLLAAEK